MHGCSLHRLYSAVHLYIPLVSAKSNTIAGMALLCWAMEYLCRGGWLNSDTKDGQLCSHEHVESIAVLAWVDSGAQQLNLLAFQVDARRGLCGLSSVCPLMTSMTCGCAVLLHIAILMSLWDTPRS